MCVCVCIGTMLLWPLGRPFKELAARLLRYSLIKTRHFLKNHGVLTLPPRSGLRCCSVIVPLFLKKRFCQRNLSPGQYLSQKHFPTKRAFKLAWTGLLFNGKGP